LKAYGTALLSSFGELKVLGGFNLTPSQRITNLYTFVQFVQLVCLDFYIHVH